MSRPDNDLIAEVILFSEGFKTAKTLGRKLVAVFTLSKYILFCIVHTFIVTSVLYYLHSNIMIGD